MVRRDSRTLLRRKSRPLPGGRTSLPGRALVGLHPLRSSGLIALDPASRGLPSCASSPEAAEAADDAGTPGCQARRGQVNSRESTGSLEVRRLAGSKSRPKMLVRTALGVRFGASYAHCTLKTTHATENVNGVSEALLGRDCG